MTSTRTSNKLFGNNNNNNNNALDKSNRNSNQNDINCLQFSKLSISSPRNSRKDYKNSGQTSGQTMPTESSGYRPILPRIEFPSSQFERLLRMDTKDMKTNSWKSSTKTSDTNKNSKYANQ